MPVHRASAPTNRAALLAAAEANMVATHPLFLAGRAATLDDADVERLAESLPRLLQNLPETGGRSRARAPRRPT